MRKCPSCGQQTMIRFKDCTYIDEDKDGSIFCVPDVTWSECLACGRLRREGYNEFKRKVRDARENPKDKPEASHLLASFFRQLPIDKILEMVPGPRLDAIIAVHLHPFVPLKLVSGEYFMWGEPIPDYSSNVRHLAYMQTSVGRLFPDTVINLSFTSSQDGTDTRVQYNFSLVTGTRGNEMVILGGSDLASTSAKAIVTYLTYRRLCAIPGGEYTIDDLRKRGVPVIRSFVSGFISNIASVAKRQLCPVVLRAGLTVRVGDDFVRWGITDRTKVTQCAECGKDCTIEKGEVT